MSHDDVRRRLAQGDAHLLQPNIGNPGALAALPEEHREAVPSAEAPGELARGLHSFQAAVFAQEEALEAGEALQRAALQTKPAGVQELERLARGPDAWSVEGRGRCGSAAWTQALFEVRAALVDAAPARFVVASSDGSPKLRAALIATANEARHGAERLIQSGAGARGLASSARRECPTIVPILPRAPIVHVV